MKSDLRGNPSRSMGRYWLMMADSAAFTLVRSSIGVAEELRNDLAEQTGLPVRLDSVELAVLLLTAAESGWGKGKASQLVGQILDLAGVAQSLRSRAYLLVRDTMAKLPLVLWQQEKLAARRDLLDELTRMLNQYQLDLTVHPSRAELREQDWRETVAGMRKKEMRERG
ncbi:hypothetical protein [Pigmentiphaga sp.]|uniref:hypothetical protein n=1 Tax=Pigmentiphaga sp. TaxID=1977564 RepID=UPI0025DF5732|nr:hypothetical protein [Pigmentiphaga sp.]